MDDRRHSEGEWVGRRKLDARITRRQVLWGGIATGAGLVLSRSRVLGRLVTTAGDQIIVGPQPGIEPLVVELKRKEDLLNLTFELYNLKVVQTPEGPALTRKNQSKEAFIVVVFGSQAIAEYAFQAEPPEDLHDAPIAHATAGPTRLGFLVPTEVHSIPYTTESLLGWTALEPSLAPVADGDFSPPPGDGGDFLHSVVRAPTPTETAIEMPRRLILSPHSGLGWAHATGLVIHNGRTEIWHTRLGVRKGAAVDEWDALGRTARAIWTPDRTDPQDPFPSSLTADDRIRIVQATAEPAAVKDGTPVPVQVNRLMLSPLGGWLDVVGTWDNHVSLDAWRHLATMGRDHYVRVVDKGYLFPYGHAASKIRITERRFEEFNGKQGGFLRTEEFIVVRQPTKTYQAPGQPHDGRAWPFRVLGFTTLMTPSVGFEDYEAGEVPVIGGEPFLFHATGKDWEARDADFLTPVVFVRADDALSASQMADLVEAFNGEEPTHPLRARSLSGQKVALAEPAEPGDTVLELQTFALGADGPVEGVTPEELRAFEQPPFYPTIAEFGARLSTVEQTSHNEMSAQRFTLGPYVDHGFAEGEDGNPGAVFAVLLDTPTEVEFAADSSGGLATPDFDPRVVSRTLGAVGGDPEDITKGTFDPADVFKDSAKLLGGLKLADIIQRIENFHTDGGAMKITTRPVHDDPAEPPVKIVTELEWEPGLRRDALGLFEPDPGSLRIEAEFVQDLLAHDQSTHDIEGDLRDFKLNLVGDGVAKFMVLRFNRLHFHARTGRKTDLEPLIEDVAFAGPLEFVNRIQEFLTFGGSGPSVRVDGTGLTAAYDLPLPQIPIGPLMINDIAMTASLFIPWRDEALIKFGLSSREKPFNITYSALGGGGYFGITFGIRGLKKFECALELGAYLSLDLGVVSGSISVTAGILFEIEMIPDEEAGEELKSVGLTAYFRFVGKVEALGLVAVSLELYLGLKFEPTPVRLTGTAKAELKVKVLVFEGSVKVTVKRTVKADPNDPTFAHLYDENHWEQYAEAFA